MTHAIVEQIFWVEASCTLNHSTRASLHLPAQDLVHIGLILLAAASEPGEYIGVHAQTDELLYGPVGTLPTNTLEGRARSGASVKSIFESGRRVSFASSARCLPLRGVVKDRAAPVLAFLAEMTRIVLFAIFFSYQMDDQQDGHATSQTDCVPALLTIHDSIHIRYGLSIFKDPDGRLERDPMLSPIGARYSCLRPRA